MGKRYERLEPRHIEFIARQKIFFVATAPREGHINLSPKGHDSLRVASPDRLLWLNLTGSGNETAAHLREDDRMTLMFCAFEGDPLILRCYGRARAIHPRDAPWEELVARFDERAGARQLIELHIELVQSSCGFGVPIFDYAGERDAMTRWIERKGADGIARYWRERNAVSLDGRPTGIVDEG